jgi:tripeptide aminopeptidase
LDIPHCQVDGIESQHSFRKPSTGVTLLISQVVKSRKRNRGNKSPQLPRQAFESSNPIEPDSVAALKLAKELMAIPGPSGKERAVAEFIAERLVAAGASLRDIRHDKAHTKTPFDGEIGSLIFSLPGTVRAPRRLLMAHMDTVPVCVGSKPIRKGDFIQSADPNTGLGADDRAGCAVVLSAALTILKQKLPHPPLTFYWAIQEEVGLYGARNADLRLLGTPKLAFNWDGGPAEKLTIGATGGYRMDIAVTGLASHAGTAPEKGVSAIAIASLAIADLHRDGWHGLVARGKERGTSNVGVIQGGDATNVVTQFVRLRAEARSHNPAFRGRIVKAIEGAFGRAAREVKSVTGKRGSVTFDGRLDYEAFRLSDDEPCVVAAEAALRSIGKEPVRAISNGGLDANWMTAHGLPTVTLGCGQMNVHTTGEQLDIAAFETACRVALRLATAAE